MGAIEVPETFLAATKMGAIRVGLNPRLAGAEIAALIKDCEPRLLIYAGEHQRLVGLATSLLADAKDPPILIGFAARHGASLDYEELIAKYACDGVLEQTPHEHAMIAYTSGSTGVPKGAIYPHDKFLRTILYTAMNEGLVHDSVWLQAMPAAGVPMMHMLRTIFLAATCVIVGPWDAQRALTLIARHNITNCVLVPTMLAALLTVPDIDKFDLGSMKLLGYGASPLPPATIREALLRFRCPFLQMYGTTELLGMSHMLFPSDHGLGLTTRPELLASIVGGLAQDAGRLPEPQGPGKRDMPAIGRKGEPRKVVGRVRRIVDGLYRNLGPASKGVLMDMGPTVVLDTGRVEILIASRHQEPNDKNCFLSLGIDPARKRFLMLKSRVHWRAGFGDIAKDVIECAGTGVCTSDYGQLTFRSVRRPIYPLDRINDTDAI
jgi:acyl-CoA synthetase (AMP-forming)/AMP-acid ligase II